MNAVEHLNWDRLRIFAAVAKAGSISNATSKILITQSAASRQIKNLEEALGIDLFYRTTKGLRLTEQGEVLYNTVANFQGQLEHTQGFLNEDVQEARGRLVVTTSVDFGSTWLAPRLSFFSKKYPKLEMKVLLSEEWFALHEREADVAIRFGRSEHLEMHNRYLMTLDWGLYAHIDYLRETSAPLEPADLKEHRIISFGTHLPQPSEQVLWHHTLAQDNGCPQSNFICINNLSGMYNLALNRGGIAMLPKYMVDATSPLRPVLEDMTIPAVDVYLVYPTNLKKSKRVMALLEFLFAEAKASQSK